MKTDGAENEEYEGDAADYEKDGGLAYDRDHDHKFVSRSALARHCRVCTGSGHSMSMLIC